jgi:asparagine synthase (glutamine-hydrolysing)
MLRYGGSYPGAYLLKRGLFLPRELPRIMDPDLARDGLRRLAPLDLIRTALTPSGRGAPRRDRSAPRSAFGKVATLESSLYMRNQLLRDTDWSSMAHSLEVRVPLVDAWLLRAVAQSVPEANPPNQKWLLAKAPQPPLPDSVSRRSKSGFTTPVATWQRQLQAPSPTRECSSEVRHSGPWARQWACAVASDF